MKDNLGQRMKENYEHRTRYFLPRRTYTIIRLDGKAFHTFTKGMKRPFDLNLMSIMDITSQFICENVQGACFSYTQSDEISILLTDFNKTTTDAWFDGNVQKITSVSASLATAKFNELMSVNWGTSLKPGLAFFDSRVFTIPDPTEVENYFIWRQKDAVRNSIAMTAQSLYSHKQLEGKSQREQLDLIYEKGQNWNDLPVGFKRGRMVVPMSFKEFDDSIQESTWKNIPAIDFLKDRSKLTDLIPRYEIASLIEEVEKRTKS